MLQDFKCPEMDATEQILSCVRVAVCFPLCCIYVSITGK